jgi:hypothetical protein
MLKHPSSRVDVISVVNDGSYQARREDLFTSTGIEEGVNSYELIKRLNRQNSKKRKDSLMKRQLSSRGNSIRSLFSQNESCFNIQFEFEK